MPLINIKNKPLFNKRNKKTGFTLIELLVVLTIIGLLVAASVVIFNNAKAKGRDSQRVSEIRTLSQALAMYLNSHDFYPTTGGLPPGVVIDGSDAITLQLSSDGILRAVIRDPRDGQTIDGEVFHYSYYSQNGETYILNYCLETNSIPGKLAGCGNTLTP
jgi:prepilin-type N-terminal cleavage/methylation domain-containing protein